MKTKLVDLAWLWKAMALILSAMLAGILLNALVITFFTVGLVRQGLDQAAALAQAQTLSQSLAPQVLVSLGSMFALLGTLFLLVTRHTKRPFAWADYGLSPISLGGLGLGSLLGLLLAGLPLLGGLGAGSLQSLGAGIAIFGTQEVAQTMLLAALLALASGLGEEIAFRGYIQAQITQKYGRVVAILFTALLFSLAHPFAQTEYPLLYLLSAFGVGLVMSLAYLASGSLWTAIGLHVIWNYTQIALIAVRSATDERFFGAPLWVLQNVQPLAQMWIESVVIFIAVVGFLILYSRQTQPD
jgi:membrane protease YdiL (CAAX protease family)